MTFLDVCLVGHESLGYSQGGQLTTQNPMVVLGSHTTPWACGNLDGNKVRRDICVNYRSTFEYFDFSTGMGDGLVGNLGGT